MEAEQFLRLTEGLGIDFFTGVPDSLLAPLCDTLYQRYGAKSRRHIVAANEGGAVGLAAGHYIASGRPGLVYMQNSGIGNAVNPIASLLNEEIYRIPCLFAVGWRGQPGTEDEPQHRFQGKITVEQLELLEIRTFVLEKGASTSAAEQIFARCGSILEAGKCAAIVVEKGALSQTGKAEYCNQYEMKRERALELILEEAGKNDVFISTTGKASRELYELREKRGEEHCHDFLTVGSMGHTLMIALAVALERPELTVWCIDGDGAAIMHLGGLRIAAEMDCENIIHVVLNNGAHESVGGMPVAGGGTDFSALAKAVGYSGVSAVADEDTLRDALRVLRQARGSRFLEIKVSLGSRANLGRPGSSPRENLAALRRSLK